MFKLMKIYVKYIMNGRN